MRFTFIIEKTIIKEVPVSKNPAPAPIEEKPQSPSVYELMYKKRLENNQDDKFNIDINSSFDELRPILEEKVNIHEMKSEFQVVWGQVEDMYRELKSQLMSMQEDSRSLRATGGRLHTDSDLHDELDKKANKKSVSEALGRKANWAEVDAALSQKAGIHDLEKLQLQIDNCLERAEFDAIRRELDRGSTTQYDSHAANDLRVREIEAELTD